MNPIICPKCQTELIPHETHLQRWEDIYDKIFSDTRYNRLAEEDKVKIAISLFSEINDFIISENIEKSKMRTTQQIQQYKKENIKNIKKEA